ncbi:MAG: hypothetical protein GWN86_03790, partial [Desulfobacterales bacterium]|nr:hypothetical protein [Desulfobacterales bacterium]
ATYHTIDKAFLNELPADPVAQEIAEKCNVDLRLGDVNLPSYKLPDSFDGNEHDYLEKLVYEGLNSRDPE